MRWDGSITDCPLHVFAKSATLLAEIVYSARSVSRIPLTTRARSADRRKRTTRRQKSQLRAKKNWTAQCRHKCDRCCRKLAFAVNDAAFCQIVWREFDPHPVARYDADKMLAHPASNVGHNDVSTFDLNAKSSIGQGLRHSALDLKCFFLLFCHTRLCPMNDMGQPALEKVTPDRSPLRLAESYNPSIGLADRSSQIARPGTGVHVCQQSQPARLSFRRSVYNDKTDLAASPRCEIAAVLGVGHPAGYHPNSSFTVQLSINPLGSGGRSHPWRACPIVILRERSRPKDLHRYTNTRQTQIFQVVELPSE